MDYLGVTYKSNLIYLIQCDLKHIMTIKVINQHYQRWINKMTLKVESWEYLTARCIDKFQISYIIFA